MLPNNKVLHWTQFSFPPTYTRLWGCVLSGGLCNRDEAGIYREDIWYYGEDLFCSGHSLLPDGRVWITGGSLYNQGNDGTEATTLYDPVAGTFSDGPEMFWGRWYPTNVPLGNGETLVVAGTYCPQRSTQDNTCAVPYVSNDLPEVLKTDGTLRRLFGATDKTLPLYPWLYYASNGKVFYAGPTEQALWLNTQGTGDWEPEQSSLVSSRYRESGSSVMYDTDKVMISGGGPVGPTNSTEIINLGATNPTWTPANPMINSRKHHNMTLLADGKVLVTGGTMGKGFNNTCHFYAVNEAEVWNPTTGVWTALASMSKRRVYHSVALLLPDARVLVGGTTEFPNIPPSSCLPITNEYVTEIFTPPYLYDANDNLAARPSISSAPANINYGQAFTVSMPDTTSISKVTMVRLSSVTHSFNMNQRINHLKFSQSGSNLSVSPPAGGNECPPGHYMLFLINSAGVPSVAKIVKIS